jgi:hypothetical protein
MSRNPFCETGEGTQPLDRELCQRLHYKALEQAMGGCHTDAVPSTVDLSVQRQHSRLFGREAYLYHPESVERLFAGISLGVYRLIVELYCSRLERSMNMVWRIVQALALGAGRAGISYEAVWAVCMHLEEQRRRETGVALEQDTATWWIIPLFYEEKNRCAEQTHNQHMIVCLLDLAREVVLAFRVVDRQHMSDALGLVLYDALVGQRQPYRAAAGLSWHVPERLIVEQGLSQDCLEGCMLLGITCETKQEPPVFFQAIQVGFRREVTNRRLRVDQLTIVFDSYLHKAYDYSPLRFREDRDRIYFHLVGYNRDPAWQCPVLRHFLPLHSGVITDDGTLFYDGLHYTDELLAYWIGVKVTFRLSEHTEALIWVYLEGSMLCTALALELRRRDGTYWSHRPGRV